MAKLVGLSWPVVVGLALLGIPRVVLHDLGLIHEGTALNLVFVVVPPVCWVAAVLALRVPRPFPALVAVGAAYGIGLVFVHQLLWPDALGEGTAPEAVLRVFAVASGLFTGLLVGAVAGLVATGLRHLRVRSGA